MYLDRTVKRVPRPLGMTSVRILAAIAEGSNYGLDIVTSTGLASGTVYPTLGRLRRKGYVRPRWEDQRVAEREGRPRRRYYELSSEGREALEQGAAALRGMLRALPDPAGEAGRG